LKKAIALVLIICPGGLWCQTPGAQSSVEKQRASIRRQVHASGPATGFFLTPWTDTPKVLPQSSSASAGGDCEALSEQTLRTMVLDASQRENVDPKLVHAMIRRESGGKPCAVSAKGAEGLMQIMPATQIEIGVRDSFDAADNLAGGVRYLRQMLDRYSGNTALALAAYNAGPQRVTPGGKIPDIPETQSYVMSILGSLNLEEEAAGDTAGVK
jgi:soluble lytic murein transglycosylase-like protein